MTETTLGVLIVRPNTYKPGSVGQLTPGMMAKVKNLLFKQLLAYFCKIFR